MKKTLLLYFCFLFLLLNGCDSAPPAKREDSPQRLISTVPSITEILFDIGAGNLLVGDSRFTVYPPEAARVEKIGGLYDLNPEKILSLRPDKVFFLEENVTDAQRFAEWGIDLTAVNHRSVEGVLESYEIIGTSLGGSFLPVALEKQKELREKLEQIAEANRNRSKVRVLLCVDRSRNVGRVENIFVAGNSPFFNEILELAGGVNVVANTVFPFPNISPEGIIHLAPDVIVELFTGEGESSLMTMSEEGRQRRIEAAQQEWKTLDEKIPAVKNGRVAVILDDYATIPGPRIPLLAERLTQILHPKE